MSLSKIVQLSFVALFTTACSNNGSSSVQAQRSTSSVVADSSAEERAPEDSDAADRDVGVSKTSEGIHGSVKVLSGSGNPGGQVLIAIPGSTEIVKSATVGSDGSIHVPDLSPDTYRLILPADGVHATADLYVTVEEETGEAQVSVVRSKGCPVTITVRDHTNAVVPEAELELALTDLPQVKAPFVHRSSTNEQGKIIITGSCVRGFYKGTLSVKGRGTYEIDHGYVGTGRDTFDIVLPEQADAAVSYANDD